MCRFSSRGSNLQRPMKSTTSSRPSRERERPQRRAFATSQKKPRRKRIGVSRSAWLSWRIHLDDDRIAADLCRIDERPDPIQRTIFIDEFSAWHGDLTRLAKYCQARSPDAALRSGLALAAGSIALERLTEAEREAWKPVLSHWYETPSDGGTHSAAGRALRQWDIATPAKAPTSQPSEGRFWVVNSLGMTLLKINPGVFVGNYQTPENKDRTVQLTRAFFLSDREITKAQFEQFMNDGRRLPLKRLVDLAYPICGVNWYEAVLFCNWLSRKEGRTPCYERTGKKEKLEQGVERDAWRLLADATGYRLPTEAEWEFACRAGTTTEFASGSDGEMLRKYAVIQANGCASLWEQAAERLGAVRHARECLGMVLGWIPESRGEHASRLSDGRTVGHCPRASGRDLAHRVLLRAVVESDRGLAGVQEHQHWFSRGPRPVGGTGEA